MVLVNQRVEEYQFLANRGWKFGDIFRRRKKKFRPKFAGFVFRDDFESSVHALQRTAVDFEADIEFEAQVDPEKQPEFHIKFEWILVEQ